MPYGKYRDILEAKGKPPQPPKPGRKPTTPYSGKRKHSASVKELAGRSFAKPIKNRRVEGTFWLEDPDEGRAVPKSVLDGTLIERIVYKRNLYLFGPPSPYNWTAQKDLLGGRNNPGGFAIDFFYWFVQPNVALEVQGDFWHGPGQKYGDAGRAFLIQAFGYRYVELLESEILGHTDGWLDLRIKELVGQRIDPGFNPQSTYFNLNGYVLSRVFKEKRF